MSARVPCAHENFNAFVEVGRIQRSDSEPEIIYYSAEIKIACRECGQQFEFVGVPCGASAYQPMVSVSGDALRVPMVIPGCQVPAGLPGFGVRLKVTLEGKVVKTVSARLDELERLIAAATPGPVTLGKGRFEDGCMEGLLVPYSDEHGTRRRVLAQFNCNFPHEGDGQLFAALRNAAPTLLAIARAAEQMLLAYDGDLTMNVTLPGADALRSALAALDGTPEGESTQEGR